MPLESKHRSLVGWMNSRFGSTLDPGQQADLQREINVWGPLLTSRFLQRCALVTSSEHENPEYYEDIDLTPQLNMLYSDDGISCRDLEKLVLDIQCSSVLDDLNDRRIIPAIMNAIKKYTEKHSVRLGFMLWIVVNSLTCNVGLVARSLLRPAVSTTFVLRRKCRATGASR